MVSVQGKILGGLVLASAFLCAGLAEAGPYRGGYRGGGGYYRGGGGYYRGGGGYYRGGGGYYHHHNGGGYYYPQTYYYPQNQAYYQQSEVVGQQGAQPYQIPAGYEGYGAGTLINYGGINYTIGGDGYMYQN